MCGEKWLRYKTWNLEKNIFLCKKLHLYKCNKYRWVIIAILKNWNMFPIGNFLLDIKSFCHCSFIVNNFEKFENFSMLWTYFRIHHLNNKESSCFYCGVHLYKYTLTVIEEPKCSKIIRIFVSDVLWSFEEKK